MAMVEMVLVLPLLLLLLFGIAEVSLLFTRWLALISAVQEGARFASVYRGASCDEGDVRAKTIARVEEFASAAGNVTLDLVTVDEPCAAPGTDTVVRATHSFAFQLLPGLTQLFGPAAFPQSIPLTFASTMRHE